MPFWCAVLDDFQNAAATVADRSPPGDRVEIVPFPEHVGTEDELAAVLVDFDCVVTLRERVAFPASLLNRLSRLWLLVAQASVTLTTTAHPCGAAGTAGRTRGTTSVRTWPGRRGKDRPATTTAVR
ncbi:hypothetical protein [Streptomyces sp. NPDC088766]|uniref:hypothetical protein n=1 Tax=Streptomyces sp. NPDC088766 TaxID=3365893 RepID=UPI003801EB7D